MTARRAGNAVTFVVLLTSAAYMLVYLYRWEWNRALVSGLFFLAAEIAVVATSLHRRLRSIEDRMAAPAPAPSPALDALRASAPPPADRFAWLDERAASLNVFVPVLLGAGALLSLLAHGVERLAGATATPALEKGLASRLQLVALPAGGLLGGTPVPAAAVRQPRLHRIAGKAFVVAAALLGAFGTVQAIDLVADATQTRTDPVAVGASEVTLVVNTRGRTAGTTETAEALWVACRNVLNRSVSAEPPQPLGRDVYRFRISPAVGEHARRRLVGCLEDATLDRTSARVLSFLDIG